MSKRLLVQIELVYKKCKLGTKNTAKIVIENWDWQVSGEEVEIRVRNYSLGSLRRVYCQLACSLPHVRLRLRNAAYVSKNIVHIKIDQFTALTSVEVRRNIIIFKHYMDTILQLLTLVRTQAVSLLENFYIRVFTLHGSFWQ